jgi:DNA polymerase
MRSVERRAVATVATLSPPLSDTKNVENKQKSVDVATVAAFSRGQNFKNPTGLRQSGFQNPPPEKAATPATNGNPPCTINRLDVANGRRQGGDSGDTSSRSATVFLDFETRNIGGCDLKTAGAWRYADDPATEVLTLTYQNGDEGSQLWTPSTKADGLVSLASDPLVGFACFGDFELAVWDRIMVERHGFPPIPLERWNNVQAAGAYLALPRALDKLLPIIGSSVVKDTEGRRLTLSLSRPHPKTKAYPEVTPEALERISVYNKIDVDGLIAVHTAVGTLPERERQVWELDQKINQRGIRIDTDFVRAAKRIANDSKETLVAEFAVLTDGLKPGQIAKTRDWLKGRGFPLENLDADTVKVTLENLIMPMDVARVLQIRQTVASTSLVKLSAMLSCVSIDGRARGLFKYHGATTGRWSAMLIQPQNLPRPTIVIDPADIEELVAAVKTGDPKALARWGKPIETLMSSLRFTLVAADGARFGVGDFSMIETCVLLALAGQHDKCRLIEQGVDVYRDMAALVYGLDREEFLAIPKDELTREQVEQRQMGGKTPVLGCGYGFGPRTFRQLYLRHMKSTEQAVRFADDVVNVHYRQNWAPKVPRLWSGLENAARSAMLRPDTVVKAECGIAYRLMTKAGLPCLVCRLLNGKQIYYMNARIFPGRTSWTYWAYRKGHWSEIEPYGGQLTENVVQALARELLVDAMLRFETRDYPVVMHCHDEIVVEHPDITAEIMTEIMAERPAWAADLGVPVMVEAWTGKRYRK